MLRVKLNYYRLPIPEKIQLAYGILSEMENNPHFPEAENALKEFEAAIIKLEDAYVAALNGDRVKIALKILANQIMDVHLASLGGYVQSVSKGDRETVLSSGFKMYRMGARPNSQPVEIPLFLRTKPGPTDGQIIVKWDRVDGAKSYTLQISEDNGETWKTCETSTRSKLVIPGLSPGSRPWFRVSAFGALGYSAWSDAVKGKVAA